MTPADGRLGRALRRCLVACLALVVPAGLTAQDLPAEIRIIVPVTAGSTLDARARVMAEALGQRLKRAVVVENRTGAGGTIAALAVARSRPDGSTLLFTNNSLVISPHIYPGTAYHPLRDFAPITQAYETGMVLVVHPGLQVSALKDLVATARNQATPLSYASSGTGGLPHLGMELLKQTAGIDLVHIPYRGDAQALTDVLAGRVPLMMSGYIVAAPHIRSGSLRALAVTSRQRAISLPDVPTIVEAGYPAYSLDTWGAFVAPAGTPAGVIARLNRELTAAIATPAVQKHFSETGAVTVSSSAADFSAYLAREWEIYRGLTAKLALKPE